MKRFSKNTHNYILWDGNQIVYIGITDDVDRRMKEHISSGKKFTACIYTAKRTRKSALLKEKEDIKKYQLSHNGRCPKYNKIL